MQSLDEHSIFLIDMDPDDIVACSNSGIMEHYIGINDLGRVELIRWDQWTGFHWTINYMGSHGEREYKYRDESDRAGAVKLMCTFLMGEIHEFCDGVLKNYDEDDDES